MKLIDADKLMENKFKNDISYNAFCNLVKRQPSIDAVPVVRCKDCACWDTSWEPTRAKEGEHWCSAHDIYMGAEDFCSQAERRES